MSRSSLCCYSDSYILVSATVRVPNTTTVAATAAASNKKKKKKLKVPLHLLNAETK